MRKPHRGQEILGQMFEEKIIRKVILDKWGLRTGRASSWSAGATVETIVEIESNEANSSTSELFAAEGASWG